MSNVSDSGLQRILSAASTLFGRHGFQRTSMADIAREAGIARATLYLRFSDKSTVFEALASSLVDKAIVGAEAAWDIQAPLSTNLSKTMLAKELIFFRMLKDTPHGAELMGLQSEIISVQAARLSGEYEALLARRGVKAAEDGADLTAFDGAKGFAMFLVRAGSGLKYETQTEQELTEAIARLAKVVARAVGED
ncbi:TetR/AcrR family transcriptional regulator [Acidisoma silvae]|uniref:TetR/AcrR family transcriptional regulator n=1 Tax=Acidisoma silvae TaxID=2802396 RepID=A0A963YVF2_9PROT|nr:TetR/AcrR family transcriptional regulator [Acidisoma silvae]MCB8877897.1 TetR/AcrR family transcriptional regulator [Acidisoma silvae]